MKFLPLSVDVISLSFDRLGSKSPYKAAKFVYPFKVRSLAGAAIIGGTGGTRPPPKILVGGTQMQASPQQLPLLAMSSPHCLEEIAATVP